MEYREIYSWLEERGWYPKWYDAGTLFFWKNTGKHEVDTLKEIQNHPDGDVDDISGNQFMKGTSINFLRKVCKTETNAKAKIRLKAAILRKQDIPYSVICASLDVIPSTLSYWLNRMDEEGITASHRRKYTGSRCFLSEKQLLSLSDDLISGPQKFGFNQFMKSTRMVIQHVDKKYNTLYSARGMRELLHRIGFSSKKPRITHHKSASKEEQNRFKKTQKGQLANIPNEDTPRYVWMSQQIG